MGEMLAISQTRTDLEGDKSSAGSCYLCSLSSAAEVEKQLKKSMLANYVKGIGSQLSTNLFIFLFIILSKIS